MAEQFSNAWYGGGPARERQSGEIGFYWTHLQNVLRRNHHDKVIGKEAAVSV